MKKQKKIIFLTYCCFLVCLLSDAQEIRKQRVYRKIDIEKENNYSLTEQPNLLTNRLIVKFKEGTVIRLRDGLLLNSKRSIGKRENNLLNAQDINIPGIDRELSQVNDVLRDAGIGSIRRLFSRSEASIDAELNDLESVANEELADLNLYFTVLLNKPAMGKEILVFLNSLRIVESAYPAYKSQNASLPKEAVAGNLFTNDHSARQGYLNPAPTGIDAKYAWTLPGGKGNAVTIIDIEQQWDIGHEELRAPVWSRGRDFDSHGNGSGDHGTAVLGEMLAQHNGFGIDGICPQAAYGVSEIAADGDYLLAVSDAIDAAAARLKKGDIVLIEQHVFGTKIKAKDTCNPTQFGYVPVEYYQECFDAIRRATAKGIIVVEAGGNGEANLDDGVYQRLFDRSRRDSRAIMVGADEGGNGIPACWTNYGTRIDFFGWGQNIVSSGYGDLPSMPSNLHQKYTSFFSGTSGASPIIVGVIACMQGIRKNLKLPVLTDSQIRSIITGTPSAAGSKKIGIMPDLKASIIRMKAMK